MLTPLFDARGRSPAAVEVYDLIAEAWAGSEVKPVPGHLAVLLEGTRLFPHEAELLCKAAELNLRHGYQPEAATLIASGLKLAKAGLVHERFVALEARLSEAVAPR